jgi:mRNA-degrading endonuclease RelE of RelBE toxin-antitoxin system
MYKILVSRTFQKIFNSLNKSVQKRIKSGLKELEKDPIKARPKADISPLSGTKPQKHRLRVGEYRIIYIIEKKTIRVIEVFKRGRGYRK